jgi:hypothetical protein
MYVSILSEAYADFNLPEISKYLGEGRDGKGYSVREAIVYVTEIGTAAIAKAVTAELAKLRKTKKGITKKDDSAGVKNGAQAGRMLEKKYKALTDLFLEHKYGLVYVGHYLWNFLKVEMASDLTRFVRYAASTYALLGSYNDQVLMTICRNCRAAVDHERFVCEHCHIVRYCSETCRNKATKVHIGYECLHYARKNWNELESKTMAEKLEFLSKVSALPFYAGGYTYDGLNIRYDKNTGLFQDAGDKGTVNALTKLNEFTRKLNEKYYGPNAMFEEDHMKDKLLIVYRTLGYRQESALMHALGTYLNDYQGNEFAPFPAKFCETRITRPTLSLALQIYEKQFKHWLKLVGRYYFKYARLMLQKIDTKLAKKLDEKELSSTDPQKGYIPFFVVTKTNDRTSMTPMANAPVLSTFFSAYFSKFTEYIHGTLFPDVIDLTSILEPRDQILGPFDVENGLYVASTADNLTEEFVPLLEYVRLEHCTNCHKVSPKDTDLVQCTGCARATYCTSKCQTEHWKKFHQYECKNDGTYLDRIKANEKEYEQRKKNLASVLKKEGFAMNGVEVEWKRSLHRYVCVLPGGQAEGCMPGDFDVMVDLLHANIFCEAMAKLENGA